MRMNLLVTSQDVHTLDFRRLNRSYKQNIQPYFSVTMLNYAFCEEAKCVQAGFGTYIHTYVHTYIYTYICLYKTHCHI